MKRFTEVVTVFACLTFPGCSDSVSPIARVATVRLQPNVLDVAANGGQAGLLVNGFTADGRSLSPAPRVMLFVRDTTIVALGSSAAGRGSDLVIGRRPGTTYVVAVATDISTIAQDSVLVRVGQVVR
jgi:hypothetical protein